MKQLHITMYNGDNEEIFSDFICHIDAVDSHTNCYLKTNYSEADVIRMPYHLHFVAITPGVVTLYYDNGVHAEIIRK